MKIYQSKSDISISVLMGKKSVHVSFTPITGGGSVFATDDVRLQEAIERHHNFGLLFTLREEVKAEKAKKKKETSGKAEGETGSGDEKKIIEVACPDDAKEYLADKFEVSRTLMKSVKAIKEIAAANNVEFSGI